MCVAKLLIKNYRVRFLNPVISIYTKLWIVPLAPSGSDFRVADADSIPVVDGKFAFDLYVDEVMPYDLIPLDEFEKSVWPLSGYGDGRISIFFF